ncbi:hypothetical protein KUCAC02_000140 [Chaenocephalus aceratus]|nr:hypothetical protein KUCAC02_000140 [Chaenocephalus aceratus]
MELTRVLLSEGQVRRERRSPQHPVLRLARVLLRLQGSVEEREQSHPQRAVKAAEECFRQAKEKASYSVKPKHASGIVDYVWLLFSS